MDEENAESNKSIANEDGVKTKTIRLGGDEKVGIGSMLFVMIGMAIYTFGLGYLDGLNIPEFPSYSKALSFFVKGLFSKGEIASQSFAASVERIVLNYSLVGFAVFGVLACLFRRYKYIKDITFWGSIVMSGVVFLPLLNHFQGIFYFLVPVVGPALVTLYSLVVLIDSWHKDQGKGSLLPRISILIFLNISSWTLPYLLGKNSLMNQDNLKERFPLAWIGESGSEKGYLIWMEDDRTYWFLCNKHDRIIYGKNSDGKIFFSRTPSSDLGDRFCKTSK